MDLASSLGPTDYSELVHVMQKVKSYPADIPLLAVICQSLIQVEEGGPEEGGPEGGPVGGRPEPEPEPEGGPPPNVRVEVVEPNWTQVYSMAVNGDAQSL